MAVSNPSHFTGDREVDIVSSLAFIGIVKRHCHCNCCHGSHCHGDDYIVYVGSRSLYVLCSVTKKA